MENEIVIIAKEWLRTPYVRNTGIKGKGTDCARFIIGVFKELGLINKGYEPPIEEANWVLGKDVDKDMLINEIKKYAYEIPHEEKQAGDIATFYGEGIESHLAILVDERTIIHAVRGHGVLMHLLKSFSHRLCGIYRIKT